MTFVCRLCNEPRDDNAMGGIPDVCYFCMKGLMRRRQEALDREYAETVHHHIPLVRHKKTLRNKIREASNG